MFTLNFLVYDLFIKKPDRLTPNSKKKNRKKSERPEYRKTAKRLTPAVIVLGVISFGFAAYTAYIASTASKFLPVGILALFAGLILESYRICESWRSVINRFSAAYFISLLAFFPGKNEREYIFENHITTWPYWFIVVFAAATIIYDRDKVTAKLTEGITLLQSLSLIYWIIDYGLNFDNWPDRILFATSMLFAAFSILNALTNIQLTRSLRLMLSIGSTIIMVALGLDNISRVLGGEDITSTTYLPDGIYIGLQYFLLGVSTIYIVQNVLLLVRFIPSKNSNYRNDLKVLTREHIERYSDSQVYIGHSLLCILFATVLYGLNLVYGVLPRHTLIWLAIPAFPFVLRFADRFIRRDETVFRNN